MDRLANHMEATTAKDVCQRIKATLQLFDAHDVSEPESSDVEVSPVREKIGRIREPIVKYEWYVSLAF